jgi:23S rRNA (uracil1939-C5)-methyltransferase
MSKVSKQGDLVPLTITDLSNTGNGVGRFDHQVIFVPNTVTGDELSVRLVARKKKFSYGKIEKIISPSSQRIRPHCIVADKCGGCQWQHIEYQYQLEVKRNLIKQNLQKIGGFINPTVLEVLAGNDLGYRNKVTYPLQLSDTGNLKAGYYRQNSHKLVNLNQCPIQDYRLDRLLPEIKKDLQNLNLSIYDENTGEGALRYLGFRIGVHTGEILLTLISTTQNLKGIERQAQIWLERYPHLVGVTLNYNRDRGNTIFGKDTLLLGGRMYLEEIFGGLKLHLRPDTFFQVNTIVAEKLLESIFKQLNLQGNETIVDAYCGIGTFTLPLAQRAKKVIGIEIQEPSVQQAKINTEINHLDNVEIFSGRTEKILSQLDFTPDLVFLDPPRKGCCQEVIDILLAKKPPRLVYISCHGATLARDLKLLCQNGIYKLEMLQPADFFPQTVHVECAAFLRLQI